MIGFDITTLSAPWLMTTMGEVEDFFLHDSGESIESCYNALLKRNMRTNYGEQVSVMNINYNSWVELDYRSRVRQVIYASFYNSLKNLYRAGLFDGEDMTQPSAEILEKELRKLLSPPDMAFEEIPWHESPEKGESFLRRFQYQAVYIISELSLYLQCVMPLECLTMKKQNVDKKHNVETKHSVEAMMEMITAFWFEKIKNPEMLFERMRREALDVDGHAASGGENTSSTSAKKTERAIKKYEACTPQQKLGYQVLYSILATLRKVSYTKRTVAIVKNKLTEATREEETSAGGELEMRVEPALAQQDRKM